MFGKGDYYVLVCVCIPLPVRRAHVSVFSFFVSPLSTSDSFYHYTLDQSYATLLHGSRINANTMLGAVQHNATTMLVAVQHNAKTMLAAVQNNANTMPAAVQRNASGSTTQMCNSW